MAMRTLSLVAMLWLLATTTAVCDDANAAGISVRGVGEVNREPDLARVRIGVVAENDVAAAAQKAVNETANRILQKVQDLEVGPRDIQTVELEIGPVYSSRSPSSVGEGPRITGYRASNVVLVTVRELDRLGAVIDAALGAGGNRVDGITFGLVDERDARKEALALAVRDAGEKAQAIAEALGARLGDLRSVSEQGSAVGPLAQMQRMQSIAEIGSTPTSRGAILITGQVVIQYDLDD